jgi:hypothetical protein
MLTRVSLVASLVGLGLAFGSGCKNTRESEDPSAGDNLLAIEQNEAEFVGAGGEDDEFDEFGYEEGEEEIMESDVTAEAPPQAELPPRAEPKKRCRGRGKKRKCTLIDPKPKISAAYGVRTLMGEFRWGMTPDQVIDVLAADVEREYGERQKKAKTAQRQDRNRAWKRDQIQALKANHVRFKKALNHRWGVSLIQFEYEDDNNEEMVWVKTTPTLRKFYFFKDGELWKIFYAYSTDTWPGKSYKEIVEEKFKKWFGVSPEVKQKKDPKSGQPVVVYNEWEALNGETIRSFDMTSVHGVIVLAVIDGGAEQRIGERIPNVQTEEKFSRVVDEVLGDSDVCYNAEGDIVECGSGKVDIE